MRSRAIFFRASFHIKFCAYIFDKSYIFTKRVELYSIYMNYRERDGRVDFAWRIALN